MAKAVQLDEHGYRKFGWIDKLAYAAGDFGCNMSFALKSYLTVFWTQYMGIDEIVMASLLLLVQVWDAINDPLIGALVDADKKTTYKRGKFLAYIWLGSIGLLVAGACCFIPWKGASSMVKNILFIAGYVLWDAFYTIANVPYGSMLSLISNDPGDRAELSTWRSVGSMAGSMTTAIIMPMLIYDSSNNLKGGIIWIIALVMGVLGFIAFQFMIHNTVIRVDQNIKVSEEQEKFNVIKAVGNFCRNRAAIGATLGPVGNFIGMYGASTASTVMFQAYFQNAQLSGVFSMLAYVGFIIWIPFVGKMAQKYGKKELMTVGILWSILVYVVMLFLPITGDSKGMIMYAVVLLCASLGSGCVSCLSWSMMADAMDWNEYKFGVRDEGTTYAMHSFFRKLAQGVGPSLGLVLAVWLGYDASLGSAQPAEVALKMRYLVNVMYLISYACMFIGYALIFPMNKKKTAEVQAALETRHEGKE